MKESEVGEKPKANDYDVFAKFYDAMMGDRSKAQAKIEGLIAENHAEARTVLELAVGTGSNLVTLAAKHEIYGLDLSAKMLEVAKAKLPKGKFFHQNMVTFKLEERFDVILCLFDSINHILEIDAWKVLFRNAQQHLNQNGVFIFDVNTPEKLQRVIQEPPFVRESDGNRMEMKVQVAGDGVVNWNVKFSEGGDQNRTILHEENIKEIAVPTDRIQDMLEEIFSSVTVKPDPVADGKPIERVYFICKK
ncbi:class I SAM-dependent methyltransferase [Patescibacteria group bacterium]|nr:class I SAM-dependent methyltransferase [Patescibacteria group bacterium]